jgi:hypothetical protein
MKTTVRGEAELADYKERLLRALAETENTRRRAQRERDGFFPQRMDAESATLAGELARVEATRDRYRQNGKRVLAERRELESVLLAPRVKTALRKALHADANPGAPADEQRLCDAAFAKLTAIYKRLGAG